MATLIRFREPFREIAALQNEMSRLVAGFFDTDGRTNQAWVPAVDVWEIEDEVVYAFDLPGIPEDKISVELEDNALTVSGERERTDEHLGRRDQHLAAGLADEGDGRLDLRPHRALREGGKDRLGVVGGEVADWLRRRRPEVAVERVDVSEHHKALGAESGGEERRGAVLVDHGVDPAKAPVSASDGNAAAAARDRHRARVDEGLDRPELDDLQRRR